MSKQPRRRHALSALRRLLAQASSSITTCATLLAWILFGLAYYLDRMSRDLALIGVGAAFLSAGLLTEWSLRRNWRPPPSRLPPWQAALSDGLDTGASQWDRAFLTGARDLQGRIVVSTIRLAVCFVIAAVLPWPLQPMGLAFGLVLLLVSFIRIARFSAMRATQRTIQQLLEVTTPPGDPPE